MRIAMITVFTLILSHPHAEAQTSTTVLFSGAAQFSKENLAPTEVASGFAFTEGPTPDGVGGIWFTDITTANIHRFDIASGETTLENANSGGANGLIFDGQGRLLAAEGNAQQLTRKDGDSVEVLADMWDDKRLNSPNDIALDSLGGIYFTDPAYFNNVQGEGVYYISPNGELSQVISDLSRPNGIALSPDETTLYVAEPTATPFPGNPEMKIWKYDLMSPGIPEDPSVFVDGLFADGLTVDAFGNVFAAMFQGFGAWTPEGEPIFWEMTPDATTNVVFEDPSGTYPNRLYITAGGSLYRTQLLPVPEPSCTVLLSAAMFAIAFALRRKSNTQITRTIVGLTLIVASTTETESLAQGPSPFGPREVGHQILQLSVGEGASRDMSVDLWFPTNVDLTTAELSTYGDNPARLALATTQIASDGPFSLIVYSHGTGGDSVENTVFAESLASHGFVVASTTHLDGVPLVASSTYDRPRDVQSIIDVLFARTNSELDVLQGAINTDGVGVAGFSFGGFTALAVAAGTTDGQIAADERVNAVMPIARGSFLPEPIDVRNVKVPTLLFAGEQDDFGLDNRARTSDLQNLGSTEKFVAIVDGANHVDVGWTRCQQSPATTKCSNDDALHIESTLATAFFDRYLRDDLIFDSVLTQSFARAHESPYEFWSKAVTDATRDNRTDFADFLKLAEHYGKTGRDARRSRVGFNKDELVGFADFLLLSENFSGEMQETARPVPEPSSFTMIAIASVFLILSRRGGVSRYSVLLGLKSAGMST